MDKGTKIADICYEYFEGNDKRHRRIGSLFYYRNHSGGCPSAQLRLDIIPSVAWTKDPDVYFIGNFISSEKIPEAPYVCGDIFVPSDTRGDRTYIGHIQTRNEKRDPQTGEYLSQYFLQLFGVPLREIKKGMAKMYKDAVNRVFESVDGVPSQMQFVDLWNQMFDSKRHSLYLQIEMQ